MSAKERSVPQGKYARTGYTSPIDAALQVIGDPTQSRKGKKKTGIAAKKRKEHKKSDKNSRQDADPLSKGGRQKKAGGKILEDYGSEEDDHLLAPRAAVFALGLWHPERCTPRSP